ncbi:MerR family transcriptional regulator [Bacillus sp. ISL-51]|uniref:MerR family transcriptional regulator n=1 Tax=Bacteria TaxID=2 RepID=UPI001BE86BEA|nr:MULTISPECIES: MerR family transcriptional regulator [Bacteria]MBT2573092.1 MerR family transcriptional regulator [Bacillus sp. ISL-51]MBT2634995.1 MerR family transcriptional regulator [Bacillus sp. ISL-26]MBT2712089.1 MerR family transcriptional regulator [Pseudomonas sp. ISL-88]
MSEDVRKYFTTGEFAKLCHVKKQTLFHYDEIGLLSPELKKENGYRYYSYNQFELFQVIGLFKEVGVPLKNIKPLLKGKTPGDITALLKEKSLEIENKIKKLEHLQTMIQTKVKLTEQALETDFSSVSFQHLDEEKVMIGRPVLNLPERKYIAGISELIRYVQLNELDEGYPVGGIFAREQILNKEFYNYTHFYMKIQEGIENIHYHVKPKGLYAVGYQKGDEAEAAYAEIIQFIEENGLQMGDYAYEEYILDEVVVDGIENQITRIQLQVKSSQD